MSTRKKRSDSKEAQVEAERTLREGFAVPEGLKALTKREKVAWDQYCQARVEWSETELRGLHRIIKMETELEKLRREAASSPRTYEKSNGDIAAHPIHTELRNEIKVIQSEKRLIGLNTSAERRVGTARKGKPGTPKADGEPRLKLLA